MSSRPLKRVTNAEMYVDPDARPGWISGADRTPLVGEEVYCAGGVGEVSAVLGKTGDGSRLLEVRLTDPKAKPFFAAASNVLVTPEHVPPSEDRRRETDEKPITAFWIG